MDETDILKPKTVDKSVHIILTQAICVAIIIVTVVTVKFFFKNCYKNLKQWYKDNICVETSISEVMEQMDGETDAV